MGGYPLVSIYLPCFAAEGKQCPSYSIPPESEGSPRRHLMCHRFAHSFAPTGQPTASAGSRIPHANEAVRRCFRFARKRRGEAIVLLASERSHIENGRYAENATQAASHCQLSTKTPDRDLPDGLRGRPQLSATATLGH